MVQQVVRSGRLICLVDGAAGSAIRAYNCKLYSAGELTERLNSKSTEIRWNIYINVES